MRATIARCAVGLGFTPEDLDSIEDAVAILPCPSPRRATRASTPSRRGRCSTPSSPSRTTSNAVRMRALPLRGRSAVKRAIKHSPVHLDDEQRAAVERMCSSQAWVMLEGHAGTGKTSTLKAVVDAYRDTPAFGRAAADEVIVLSTAAATAERTARPLNADRSGSIDSFVAAVRHGAWKRPREETIVVRDKRGRLVERTITRYETWTPTERTLIIIDEAAMVDTPRMAELLACAGDAKIILVGDPKQLTAIGPGGWYAEAADKHGVFELTRVYRQKGGRCRAAPQNPRRSGEASARHAQRARPSPRCRGPLACDSARRRDVPRAPRRGTRRRRRRPHRRGKQPRDRHPQPARPARAPPARGNLRPGHRSSCDGD